MSETLGKLVALDPWKQHKREKIRLLAPFIEIEFLSRPPLIFCNPYGAVVSQRAHAALESAKKKPKSEISRALKIIVLRWVYCGARRYAELNSDVAYAVWNGTNGVRRAFSDGIRDAGSLLISFELGPLPNTVTADIKGVNYLNSVPRNVQRVAQIVGSDTSASAFRAELKKRLSSRVPGKPRRLAETSLPKRYVFAPLQVPGDSQLRLFGGEFRTVEAFVSGLVAGASSLPEDVFLVLKEHPDSPQSIELLLRASSKNCDRVLLVNDIDTFDLVEGALAVITVNSSVGLEALCFDVPVIACGQAFWAIEPLARVAPDKKAIAEAFRRILTPMEQSEFKLRAIYLYYLWNHYYLKYIPGQPKESADLNRTIVKNLIGRISDD